MSESKAVRINKFLSEAGFCSRREADKLIDITSNHETAMQQFQKIAMQQKD